MRQQPQIYDRPKFCPNCAAPLEMIRPLFGSFFEIFCHACTYTAVISANDAVALPDVR